MVRVMTRSLFAFAALAAVAAAAGPAAAADHNYGVTDFDRVIVEGPYAVHLVVGRPSMAVASGPRDALDRLTIDVQGQTLRIRRNRSAWGGAATPQPGPVTIELATRNLRSARSIGGALLDVEGARGLNVDLALEGSGRLRAIGVAVDNLSLGLLGSGLIQIVGTAAVLRADFQGTGEVRAASLAASSATVTTNTVGSVALTVNGPVTINANGLGQVNVIGRPICTVNGPGADRVMCARSNQR
jgi:Putative auto-transporter adhesin, head GIN domain